MPDDDKLAPKNDGLAEAMASIPDEPLERTGERLDEERAEPPAPDTPAKAESDGPPRDEQGRFAPKGQDEPEAPAEERDGGQVPSWRMREYARNATGLPKERKPPRGGPPKSISNTGCWCNSNNSKRTSSKRTSSALIRLIQKISMPTWISISISACSRWQSRISTSGST